MSGPPRLSVSTSGGSGAGPSTPGTSSLRRAPQGARRRAQGLFVANPDNSDSDSASPRTSPVRQSPVTAFPSSSILSRAVPIPSHLNGTGPAQSRPPIPALSSAPVLPTVPAPNTPTFPSNHSSPQLPQVPPAPTPTASAPPELPPGVSPIAPQPPPQPERHYRRAFTTPVPAPEPPQRAHETRHASVSGASSHAYHPPSSPSRHLPTIPSPPTAPSSGPYTHPEASGSRSQLQQLHTMASSPEDITSPAGASDGGKSLASFGSGEARPRSGSIQSQKVLLQVTMDNEQFTLVDVTGMHTAEGILERVFSKLRFRDDDYSTLSLYRTEIGDTPADEPISKEALLQLCQQQGDHRASLKFLVLQTAIPGSTASIVPPVRTEPPTPQDRQLPPIDTQFAPNRNSKDGSLSSASGSSNVGQSEWSDQAREQNSTASSIGSALQRGKQPARYTDRRLPSASSSNRSLNDITQSQTSSPRSINAPSLVEPRYTPGHSRAPSTRSDASANAVAGPSTDIGLGFDDGMDPATRALIEQMQREDEIARQEEHARRRQLEEDERFARNEQQQERDVWQAMQQMQLEQRRREQQQIEEDEQRARELDEEERHVEQSQRRDSFSRNATFSNDRRAQRQEWSQRNRDGPEAWTLPGLPDSRPGDTPPYSSTYDQQVYTSPSNSFGPQVPDVYVRQPTRNNSGRYEEEDPRYLGGGGINPGDRVGMALGRRQPTRHPYGYTNDYNLQNARSMDNLRPVNAGVSRMPYQGVSPQPPRTPQPGDRFRDRSQDGRYPEQIRTGSVPFPSPRPRRQGSGEQSYLPYAQDQSSTFHYDRSGSDPASPQTSRRPNTYNDESPPLDAHTFTDGYFPPGAAAPYFASQSRRNSMDQVQRGRTPTDDGFRRASESSAGDPHSPYLGTGEGSWVPRSQKRNDTSDSGSVAGTVSSEATVRAMPRGDESTSTARAGDLQSQWRAMVRQGRDGTIMPPRPVHESAVDDDEDEDEATLWITAPGKNVPLHSPSRPNLTITTGRQSMDQSDSNTESEAEEPSRVHRSKSFAKPKDQWAFRPDPEQLYENLDALFPKVDLDKPIVEGLSTPTTPSESPATNTSTSHLPPPPVHPTRQADTRLPQSPKQERISQPPPVHPSKLHKLENRKSIRVVADFARRAIQRDNKDKDAKPAKAAAEDPKKLERRRSSAMWGHQLVEVTPSKIAGGQIQPIPESPTGAEERAPIQNWVKGELIGKGSYGRVYIALNVSTGDMMAVKQVELPATERDRNDSRQLQMIEALRSEIALLKDLYHPNIVQYLGTETSDDFLSIFLEYVPGGTIASIYRAPGQSPFEEQLVKFFTKQILEGLAYIHNKQILHRDLKGDNILVDANGICKISDFGISKQASDAYDSFGQATNMKGSIFWMAPEVIHSASERTYSGKVDIWSLGCVVMEMWTGQRPWGVMEQVAAMFELFNRRARPPVPPEILHAMSDVALDFMNDRCLAKDPRDRPTAKELLQHRFILDTDKKWTFANSKIGKAVASRGVKKLQAHQAAHASGT